MSNTITGGERRYYLVVSLLILVASFVYFSDVSRVGFVTHDERVLSLEGANVREYGFSQLVARSIEWSNGPGRVGFRIMFVPIIGAYLVDANVRPELITFVQISAYVTIAVFLSFYIGIPTASLVLASLLCLITHPGHHYPDAANPLIFHLELALFFAGFILQMRARQTASLRSRYLLTPLACAFIFLGVSFYESMFLVCGLVECAIVYSLAAALAETERGPKRRRAAFRKAVMLEAPIFGTLFAYAVLYAGFRYLHPSVYDGNTIRGAIHPGVVAKSIFLYGVGGLPGVNWFLGQGSGFLKRELAQGVNVRVFFMHHFGWSEGVLGLGLAASVCLYVRHWAEWAPNQRIAGSADASSIFFWRRRGVSLAMVSLLVALAAQVPMAVVSKYNQNPEVWVPHVSSLFGFVALCVCAPALLMALFVTAGAFRTLAAMALALGSFVLCVASREVSMLVVSAQEKDYVSSRMVDLFIGSKSFADIPNHSLLVAPSLWDTPTLDPTEDADYWQHYINLRTGRSLRVRASLPDESQIEPRGMYYIEHQRSPDGARLLISPLHVEPSAEGPVSDSLTVISQDPMDDSAVVFQQRSDAGGGTAIGGETLQVKPLQSHYDGTLFVATIAVQGGFVPGSAYVVSREAALGARKLNGLGRSPDQPLNKVGIEFGGGFSRLEQSDSHYWHWSDGTSGTGEVTLLNRTPSPLRVVFAGCITTGYAKPSKVLFRLAGESATTTSTNVCSPFSRAWTLVPGKNTLSIHSDAQMLKAAPGDPRHIIFGLFDWKLILSR